MFVLVLICLNISWAQEPSPRSLSSVLVPIPVQPSPSSSLSPSPTVIGTSPMPTPSSSPTVSPLGDRSLQNLELQQEVILPPKKRIYPGGQDEQELKVQPNLPEPSRRFSHPQIKKPTIEEDHSSEE